jgi:hypothetical protein
VVFLAQATYILGLDGETTLFYFSGRKWDAMKSVSIKINPVDYRTVKRLAKQERRNMVEVISAAIRMYNRHTLETAKEKP